MVLFSALWNNHPGRANVCDQSVFGNQCAMRMGQALERCGINLANEQVERCSDYSDKFSDHKPGHIRSAQDLANIFYRKPVLLGTNVKTKIVTGSIQKNIAVFKDKTGMVFIMNGWGTTDHIDVWDGRLLQMKGAALTADYMKRGQQTWFWEIK